MPNTNMFWVFATPSAEGVAKDEVEAVKWYRKAAEQNYAKAQYDLGFCYYNGEGVDAGAGVLLSCACAASPRPSSSPWDGGGGVLVAKATFVIPASEQILRTAMMFL